MKIAKPRSGSSTDGPAISRRRTVRVTPPPELRCAIAGLGNRVPVQDISLGGIAILTSRAIAPGAAPHLTLQFGAVTIAVQARVIHCEQDGGQWLIGLAFNEDPRCAEAIDDLLDAIAASSLRFS